MKNFVVLIAVLLFSCTGSKSTIGDRRSWELRPIDRLDSANPVLEPEKDLQFVCPIDRKSIRWEEKAVFGPATVVKDGRVWMLYRAEDKKGKHNGTSRIGLANSRDGLDFKKVPTPVLYPDNDFMKEYEWEGGCEDPRVVKGIDGKYVMTYTAFDGKTARLCIALSEDLYTWEKKGLAFTDRKYRKLWSKSGAILCREVDGSMVAVKIQNKYWMYWGDRDIYLATSDDLISWEPYTDRRGNLTPVLRPRTGFFDSGAVEPGPFALQTPNGILLLYNGSGNGACSVGQALFDEKKPERLNARSNTNYLRPEKSYETRGQKDNVCFVEGMVYFNRRWYLYYGAADEKIAVAEVR